MAVTRVHEEPEPLQFVGAPDDDAPALPSAAEIISGLAGALNTRMGLWMAIIGTFALSWRALGATDPTPNALWGVAIFGCLAILPLVWLNLRRPT